MNSERRAFLICLGLIFVLAGSLVFSLFAGRYEMTKTEIFLSLFRQNENIRINTVIWKIRVPRIVMSMAIGAGLSVAGVAMQAMFGNPLVSPHVLGVSHAAGFGAALGLLILNNFLHIQIISALFGFLGMFITYSISRRRGQSNVLMLILSGIIVAAVFQALTSLVKFVADPEQKLPSITYWLMGSLAGSSWPDAQKCVPVVFVSITVLWLIRWRLNIISLREEEAISLGVNIRQTRTIVIICTTIITAASVSFCGVIAFVGLAVPHFARMLCGNDHKYLLLACCISGAIFLLIIDTIARSATATEIPLSILTAIIGAPVFAFLLHKTGGAWDD